MSGPEILLSADAHARGWDRIVAVAPGAIANVLAGDGTWSLDGVEAAEVAFGTPDLYGAGLTRRFFGGMLHAPSLRWFQSMAAGSDDPVYARLRANGVRVTTAHVNAIPIAEFVLWAVLDHVLEGDRMRADAAEARWVQRVDRREAFGATLTIVGMGAIGHETAVRARAFGMRVRGVRRTPTGGEPVDEMFRPDRLSEALDGADAVVLAMPLDETTKDMAGRDFFAAMAPGSLLVNVGRGGLVDEAALLEALARGAPGHATLDVVVEEPLPPESPLWRHDRITITPHIAGSSTGNAARLVALFCDNLRRYLAGEPLPGEIA